MFNPHPSSRRWLFLLALIFTTPLIAVDMDLVTVDSPGNDPDVRLMNDGTFGYGSVDYTYQIGKFEVTAGQYTDFLNAVADIDTYSLYNESMLFDPHGCQIQRSGLPGSYTYSVPQAYQNRPVNYVSFWDACRFVNWLENKQPVGLQNDLTTEHGTYDLDGYLGEFGSSITRALDASWCLPYENEWYKSAYFDPEKSGGPGYWNYATRSSLLPSNQVTDPDGGNNANFAHGDYTIGAPYYSTPVGEFENSASAFGTYDQTGNMAEWNETVIGSSSRGLRGGAFSVTAATIHHSNRRNLLPNTETSDVSFRVAFIPEPISLSLVTLGALALLRRRR